MDADETRERVVGLARREGFPLVRIAAATIDRRAREAALAAHAAGNLDGLGWMTEAWLRRATDPGAFLPGARSVVLCALPYRGMGVWACASAGADGEAKPARGRVAAYAHGRDYHRVFEKKLRRVARVLREEFGALARATVDYGPLLERAPAVAAGMGWSGKSTMLLAPGFGPWVMLGAVATNLDLAPDGPLRKTCGSCTRCITACPTGALAPDGHVLDARLCISYHTIENRGPVPRELRADFGDWIFGCDACLDACPVGAGSTASHPDLLARSQEDARPELAPLLQLDEAAFQERYRGRPILRAKRDGFLRNVCIALGNVGTAADLPALCSALDDPSALVRGHAAWAVARLVTRVRPGSALSTKDSALRSLESRLQIEQDAGVREEIELAIAAATRRPLAAKEG
ncbi:MAG: tRNA epoxyqueuosine(34) reductase QueG [Chloroflexi bacterium]|nr:tRNA epoxyqueuosine(34) reductase QueG [Chloroflexota bacterium]